MVIRDSVLIASIGHCYCNSLRDSVVFVCLLFFYIVSVARSEGICSLSL